MPDAWVYLLRCADGSLYTGWTVDLDARLRRHGAGTASAYTRSRRPVELALALPMPDRSAARREEARIKALDRRAKLALIADALAPECPAPEDRSGDVASVGRCRSNGAPLSLYGPGRATHDMPTTEFPAVTDDAQARNGHVKVERRERVIVRFAGDSGDGMQLAGGRFTDATAVFGNDLATLPSFPAEIRAPAGSLAGVSSFQIHFAERDIATPGDTPNVLVAMNPAALRANVAPARARGDDHRQRGRLHHAQPAEGGLRRRARSRTTRSTPSRSSACR